MTTHRSWPAMEKFHIILERLFLKANVVRICRGHTITSDQFYKRRERDLVSMKTTLKSGEGTVEQGLLQENGQLTRQVANQALAPPRSSAANSKAAPSERATAGDCHEAGGTGGFPRRERRPSAGSAVDRWALLPLGRRCCSPPPTSP